MSLEKLSTELRTYVNNTISEAITTGKPLVFRRIGSDQKYMRSNPPRERKMSKIYSPYFEVFDPFDKVSSNKTLVYTQGVETRIIGGTLAEISKKGKMESDERGYIRPNMSDTLLIACLLLSSKNGSYKYRDKSVTADWVQVKDGVKGFNINTELLKMKTEHQLAGIIFQMNLTELQAYATELQSSANVGIAINRPTDELRTSLVNAVKKDPIFYGRFIPTPESNVKVLASQAINADVIIFDVVKREWNFVHKWNKETEGFAGGSLNATSAEEKLIEFLLKNEGKKIKKKIEKILFPTDDDGWEFLNNPPTAVNNSEQEKTAETAKNDSLDTLLQKMNAMQEEINHLKKNPNTEEKQVVNVTAPVINSENTLPETVKNLPNQPQNNPSNQKAPQPLK